MGEERREEGQVGLHQGRDRLLGGGFCAQDAVLAEVEPLEAIGLVGLDLGLSARFEPSRPV